jgi:hypothetical protein
MDRILGQHGDYITQLFYLKKGKLAYRKLFCVVRMFKVPFLAN